MLIALLNNSQRYRGREGILNDMAVAVTYQLRMHVAPSWKVLPWRCVYYSDERNVPIGAYRLWVLDSSGAAGLLGYHGQDPGGNAYGRVFVDPIISRGGTDLLGPRSVSIVVSHEACEMMMNPEINSWRQLRDGRMTVEELCDAVQGDYYNINVGGKQVSVSNFLLPSWFDYAPGSASKFDYMGKLGGPFSLSRGGYMMVMSNGQIRNVFGSQEAEAEFYSDESKLHEAARGSRVREMNLGSEESAQELEIDLTPMVGAVVERVETLDVVVPEKVEVKRVGVTDRVMSSIKRMLQLGKV